MHHHAINDMLYDYRVVMEFTPTGNMFPSLTTRYHFTSVLMVYALLLSVEVMQINKQNKQDVATDNLSPDYKHIVQPISANALFNNYHTFCVALLLSRFCKRVTDAV